MVTDEELSQTKQEGSGPGEIGELTPKQQQRIIRRIDLRLVVTCGLMYCISLIDRLNLPNAAIAGMNEDLQLIGDRYTILVLIFFPLYAILQPLATNVLRWVGPRPMLAGLCFAWGVVLIGHGFTYQWTAMIPLRLILGALEAGFFPGALYLISTWYTRQELHRRFAGFYLVGTVAQGLGGILAFGLIQMDGLAELRGWRWIFIIEGILTAVLAIISYFALVDFPDKSATRSFSFLSARECAWVIRRIEADRDDAEVEPFNLGAWARHGLDLKVWGFALLFCVSTTTAYAIAYFLPIILRGMGFSAGASQILIAPPYVLGGILMAAVSWAGDRYGIIAPLLVGNAVVTIVGLVVMGYATGGPARYIGVFLTTAAANANVPCIMAYQAKNIRGQWKRAFASASLVGAGAVGGVAGSLVFRNCEAPLYRPGIYATITANGMDSSS